MALPRARDIHVSTISARSQRSPGDGTPLCNGDRFTQPEFHRLYETCPENSRFELIGGTVYMASPLRREHGKFHAELAAALTSYEAETPGVELLDNASTILGAESEVQPDLLLRILAECGGRSRVTSDGYIAGPPELIVEIAHSTRAIDMHQKRDDYRSAGVREYLVLCVRERELHWLDFKSRRPLRADPQGICRSRAYPGLWFNGAALLDQSRRAVLATIEEGLASPEHAAFVRQLQKRRERHK